MSDMKHDSEKIDPAKVRFMYLNRKDTIDHAEAVRRLAFYFLTDLSTIESIVGDLKE